MKPTYDELAAMARRWFPFAHRDMRRDSWMQTCRECGVEMRVTNPDFMDGIGHRENCVWAEDRRLLAQLRRSPAARRRAGHDATPGARDPATGGDGVRTIGASAPRCPAVEDAIFPTRWMMPRGVYQHLQKAGGSDRA